MLAGIDVQEVMTHLAAADCNCERVRLWRGNCFLCRGISLCKARQLARPAPPETPAAAGLLVSEFAAGLHLILHDPAAPAGRLQQACMLQ